MPESRFFTPPSPENVNPLAEELVAKILPFLEKETTVEEFEGTYEIDSDSLRLSFTIDDDLLEIRNIESLRPGLGREALSQIHALADTHKMTVIAATVKDTARSFWEGMDYYEGSTPDEFIRR